MSTPLLDQIQSPDDLRKLSLDQLEPLAKECREALIDIMSKTSGHFASSLGVVELTIALHYIYNTPDDQIVWDVGHQAYIHKMLTGRRHLFPTLRKYNGLSGFPKRDESPYDTFGVGHASTSISAGYGMVCAIEALNEDRNVISVIGDGALTGGLAFEGLNNAGAGKRNFVVILNDNDMSIDDNVGALNRYFTQIMTSTTYNQVKQDVWQWANKRKSIGKAIQKIGHKIEEGLIGSITPGAIFEQLGFSYIGPVDGHDLPALVEVLSKVKEMPGPMLVHLITKKGKGYKFAESDALKYHAVSVPFDPEVGMEKPVPKDSIPYTKVFADAVADMTALDSKLATVTPAMISGSGLKAFSQSNPENVYDVGIAEGHAVTFAAGIATQGVKVIATIYSTFLQRAYDNIIHDVAIQNLHVFFAIDRAGVVGADGPTHHGCYDISYLRLIPNMTIMVPRDGREMRDMMYTGVFHFDAPISMRYPRDSIKITDSLNGFERIEIGKSVTIKEGEHVAILALGTMIQEVEKTIPLLNADGIDPALINPRFVKPLDTEMLDDIAARYSVIITMEEGSVPGGFGSAVSEYYMDRGKHADIRILRIGIPDRFIPHGSRADLFKDMELDYESLHRRILAFVNDHSPVHASR